MISFKIYLEIRDKFTPWGEPGDVDVEELERKRDIAEIERIMDQIKPLNYRQLVSLKDQLQPLFARLEPPRKLTQIQKRAG
jgi:hypothetical protein